MFSKTALLVGTMMMSAVVASPVYAGSTKSDDQSNTMATDEAIKSDANDMGDKIAAQYEDAKDFTYEQKEEFLAWVDEQSDELGDSYDDASENVKQNSEEAYEEMSAAWNDATDELGDAVDDAQDASADTWEDVKKNTVAALEKAKKTISDSESAE